MVLLVQVLLLVVVESEGEEEEKEEEFGDRQVGRYRAGHVELRRGAETHSNNFSINQNEIEERDLKL